MLISRTMMGVIAESVGAVVSIDRPTICTTNHPTAHGRSPGRAEIRSTEYDTPRARATHRSTHGKMCWGFSQRLIAAYAHPDRRRGKTSPTEAINGRLDALRRNALGLPELRALMRGDSRLSPHSRFHTEHPASDPPHRLNGRRTHHANRQRD